MLKRDVTYEDFNGNKITETLYFNLNRSEIFELSAEGNLPNVDIQGTMDRRKATEVFMSFRAILLKAYGQKSEDGKRFVKTPELREEFEQSAAYDAIFTQLTDDEKVLDAFVMGIMPKDVVAQVQQQLATQAPLPPTSAA